MTTPRTTDEVQAMIEKLTAHAELQESVYRDYIERQPKFALEDRDRLSDAASLLGEWERERQVRLAQARVLKWVIGKYEEFPWF